MEDENIFAKSKSPMVSEGGRWFRIIILNRFFVLGEK
jgi:hypothetical protein